MARTKQPFLVIGNWKMNPPTAGNAKKLFLEIRERLARRRASVRVVVAPPTPFISDLAKLSPSGRIELGAQDVSLEKEGAFTGEVSAAMLASVNARLVIVGHSERRAQGEDDEHVAKTLMQALAAKLTSVLCVGEVTRDRNGNYFTEVERQLTRAVQDVTKPMLANLAIAYEPVWAIGTGTDAAPADVHEMRLFIQKVLADRFGKKEALAVPILYGGSVTPRNADALVREGHIDGFLVGGASLRAHDFAEIVTIAHAAHKATTAA